MRYLILFISFTCILYSNNKDNTKFVNEFKKALVKKDTNWIISNTEFPFYSYDETNDALDVHTDISFREKMIPYLFSKEFINNIASIDRLVVASTEIEEPTLKKINQKNKTELLLLNFEFGSLIFKEKNKKLLFVAGIWIPITND